MSTAERPRLHIDRRWKILWAVVLTLAWGTVIVLLVKNGGRLTVEQILHYRPENALLAALIMEGLFLLKGMDLVIHSGVLYAANGVMFPLPVAVALNCLGALLMSVTPYFIGRTMGPPIVEYVLDRYPKIRSIASLRSKNELLIAFLLRCTGMPLLPSSLYMGATRFHFGRYLLGSVGGLLPLLIAYTVMGTGVGDLSSPVFWVAFGCSCAVSLLAVILSAVILRRERNKDKENQP